MADKLSPATKLKLLLPIIYLCLSLAAIIMTWPKYPTWHDYVGGILTIIGFTLWIVARIQLGNAFSIASKAKSLVTTGIYSKLRHPVYYFSITAVLGLSFYMWQQPMIFVVILLVILEAMRIHDEERVLAKAFGKKYLDYKKTSWF